MKAIIRLIGGIVTIEMDGTPQEMAELWYHMTKPSPTTTEKGSGPTCSEKKEEPLGILRQKKAPKRKKAPRKARGR